MSRVASSRGSAVAFYQVVFYHEKLVIGIVPWPEPGHINATRRLRTELLARGHHVHYIARARPNDVDLFAKLQLPFVLAQVPAAPNARDLTIELSGPKPDLLLVDPVFSEEPMLFWRRGWTVFKLSSVFPMRARVGALRTRLTKMLDDQCGARAVEECWSRYGRQHFANRRLRNIPPSHGHPNAGLRFAQRSVSSLEAQPGMTTGGTK